MGLLIVALSLIGLVRATSFYEVGNSNGWTTTMGIDYCKSWSTSKTFYAGDSLIFQYNKALHNVMEVSSQDFESCNPNSPLTTYQSQHEPVLLNRTGHFYFICGVPGHCESGQKLDVLVMPASLENITPSPINQPDNGSSSNPKPNLSPTPIEDPLEVLLVDDATIATLPDNAASSPCVWSGLSMLSFFLLKTLVFV
ncbi:PREDICTED: mavicyanin-like [Camelina sativa]|uniref:Mavicyanin-like n=1 Tax=Camelina sativa TaxID=90675 RepID=A0ABM0WP15_CAMSA|nr:PREDICTED: mavicyanin-like [Camelina sativa]